MSRVCLLPRDLSILRLLDWTPLTTALLVKASPLLDGEPFPDQRRRHERLQALCRAGFIRSWTTTKNPGYQNYYKLAPAGFQALHGHEEPLPLRAFFREVRPSLAAHTFRLAEAIMHTVLACHARGVRIVRFIRENGVTFTVGQASVQPDAFFVLDADGMHFNVALELDNGTESNDSHAVTSIRSKLTVYHMYQERLLERWLRDGKQTEEPRFRVVFLTPSVTRACNILSLASRYPQARERRLVYAAAFNAYIEDPDPLFAPLFLDHFGNWQALVNLHPKVPFPKEPVRLARPVASAFALV